MPNETLSSSAHRVVLVDSRDDRRELMRHVVQGDDTKAVLAGEANSKATALEVVDEQRADVVVIDLQMPVPEGMATIAALRESYPHLGIVVCSFDLDRATAQSVLAQGADVCLAKPVRRSDVHVALSDLPRHDRPSEGPAPLPAEAPVTAAAR